MLIGSCGRFHATAEESGECLQPAPSSTALIPSGSGLFLKSFSAAFRNAFALLFVGVGSPGQGSVPASSASSPPSDPPLSLSLMPWKHSGFTMAEGGLTTAPDEEPGVQASTKEQDIADNTARSAEYRISPLIVLDLERTNRKSRESRERTDAVAGIRMRLILLTRFVPHPFLDVVQIIWAGGLLLREGYCCAAGICAAAGEMPGQRCEC